jgi:hypothetical protein
MVTGTERGKREEEGQSMEKEDTGNGELFVGSIHILL